MVTVGAFHATVYLVSTGIHRLNLLLVRIDNPLAGRIRVALVTLTITQLFPEEQISEEADNKDCKDNNHREDPLLLIEHFLCLINDALADQVLRISRAQSHQQVFAVLFGSIKDDVILRHSYAA